MDNNIEETFRINLKKYLQQKNKKQYDLAKYLNVTPATISYYIKGTYVPRMDKVDKIAEFFNIERSDLIGHNEQVYEPPKPKMIKIPVLGEVAAGIPIDAIENIIDYEEITENLAHTGEFFGLKIKGDSMYPMICDKDIVIVRKQPNVENGEVAIVLVNGNEATCKKIKKDTQGITLVPKNPEYKEKTYTNKEIQTLPVTIIGKVIELRRRF